MREAQLFMFRIEAGLSLALFDARYIAASLAKVRWPVSGSVAKATPPARAPEGRLAAFVAAGTCFFVKMCALRCSSLRTDAAETATGATGSAEGKTESVAGAGLTRTAYARGFFAFKTTGIFGCSMWRGVGAREDG